MSIGLQNGKPGQAGAFYSEILAGDLAGLSRFKPEDFRPCIGTVLVVKAPPETQVGAIHLTETAHRDQGIARVAAVPDDPKCPVQPGDWAIFIPGAALNLTLGGRQDIAILRYEAGPESEITGFIPRSALDVPETTP